MLYLAILGMAASVGAAEPTGQSRDILYQASTINALLAGGYAGILTCGELTRHGDFGLGTFEALDGEMIVLDRTVYQVRNDGTVQTAGPAVLTPFANVTFFEPDVTFELRGIESLDRLQKEIERRLVNRHIFYAIRLDGAFDALKVRSVPKQTKPYPKLAEVVKHQSVFELKDIKGTLIGFWCPAFAQALNVPGFHLHFLAEDRKSGGHVLDCRLKEGKVSLDLTAGFTLQLPEKGFGQLDLSGSRAKELDAVEK